MGESKGSCDADDASVEVILCGLFLFYRERAGENVEVTS